MPDRNSATSVNSDNYIDPVVEEATIAMRTDSKSLAQLSSSGNVARVKRVEKAKINLDKAVQRVVFRTKQGRVKTAPDIKGKSSRTETFDVHHLRGILL